MNVPYAQLLLPSVALALLTSFGWAMAFHFQRPKRLNFRARLIVLLGIGNAALQLHALFAHPAGWWSLAFFLYVLSGLLFWSAVRVSRNRLAVCFEGNAASPTSIVTTGPYRWIRHPFYTAYTLHWLAGVVATAWWPTGLALAPLLIFYALAARDEEAALLTGETRLLYANYRKHTGRFLPSLLRTKPDQSHRVD